MSVPNDLKEAILDKQGDLLYTTLSEECSELIKACSKIIRKKFYNEPLTEKDFNNFFEEIGDVELNLECIKDQIARECSISRDSVDLEVWSWQEGKNKKLSDIFLK